MDNALTTKPSACQLARDAAKASRALLLLAGTAKETAARKAAARGHLAASDAFADEGDFDAAEAELERAELLLAEDA